MTVSGSVPTRGMKHLIFLFLRFGNDVKYGVEFHRFTRNASRVWHDQVGFGSVLMGTRIGSQVPSAYTAMCGIPRESKKSIKLIKKPNQVKLLFSSQVISINQLYAVSRTQQGRQRKPNGKIHRSILSAEFWRLCVLSGGTQRRTLPRHQSEEIKI